MLVTVSIPTRMTVSHASAGAGVCLIDAAAAKMVCALTTLAPQTGGPISCTNPQDWSISFAATVNSTDLSGEVLTSQASATASSTGSTPAGSTTVVVGTTLNGGLGGLGWPELLALGGMAWFGRRRLTLL